MAGVGEAGRHSYEEEKREEEIGKEMNLPWCVRVGRVSLFIVRYQVCGLFVYF